jgi:hypothetical protein
MLKRGENSSKFFYIEGSTQHAAQTKLRDIVHNTHDMPVSKTTLEERIMGFTSDDNDDDSITDNFQGML